MCLSSVPNLNEIDSREGYLFLAQNYFLNRCEEEEEEEEKYEENRAIFRNK